MLPLPHCHCTCHRWIPVQTACESPVFLYKTHKKHIKNTLKTHKNT
jgi:hypothetical protein